MIFLQKFLTNWRAQRGKFLTTSLMFRDFSYETLCVDKIISSPRGILWVDKIGSADRGILCVDKIGSPEIPQDPCWPLKCLPLICWPLICWPLICSPLIRRDCLPARIRGWAGTATGPHSHVVHISHTPTERAHTDPKKISFGKKIGSSKMKTGIVPKFRPAGRRRGFPPPPHRRTRSHPPSLAHLHMSSRLTLIHPDCHLLGKKTKNVSGSHPKRFKM